MWAEQGGALQVFDKALTETTFCETYADLCCQLNAALPSFEPALQDTNQPRPSTFRSAVHLGPLPPALRTTELYANVPQVTLAPVGQTGGAQVIKTSNSSLICL